MSIKTVVIEIFWDDLKEEKQNEILEALGDNLNWDVIPLKTLEIEIECPDNE